MDKDSFRKIAKKRLLKESKIFAKSKSNRIFDELNFIIKKSGAKNILIYLPLKFEPNSYYLINKLKNRANFYLPFMQDVNLKLVKLKRPFKKAKFGVMQPPDQNEQKKRIDMAIIPVVGVDGTMARVGHGKGYYDRFFSKLNYRPLIVFVQTTALISKQIIAQKHDIKGDFYITPTKKYIIRGKNDRNFYRTWGGGFRRRSWLSYQ